MGRADEGLLAWAVRLLAGQPYTRYQLRSKLEKRGAPEEEVERVLGILLSRRFLDDASYAQEFARRGLRERGTGPEKIVADLAARGIDGSMARAAIDRVLHEWAAEGGVNAGAGPHLLPTGPGGESTLLEQALARWFQQHGRPATPAAVGKAAAFLQRRGFDPDEVREWAEAAMADLPDPG